MGRNRLQRANRQLDTRIPNPSVNSSSSSGELNSAIFPTFPVAWKLLHLQRPTDPEDQLTFNMDFTGSLTRVIDHSYRNEMFTWKSKGKMVSLTSGDDAHCTQKWTFYSNKETNQYHIRLAKNAAFECSRATGLLHSVQDIGLEVQEINDITEPETSIRKALTKKNYAFRVSYQNRGVGATSSFKFLKDGRGISTRSVLPPPGGDVANFRWSVQNNSDLTLASIEDPGCTQVWIASLSGSKVVLHLKKGDINDCGLEGGLLPTSQTKKVTLTPAKN
jgi:hypothetical protein